MPGWSRLGLILVGLYAVAGGCAHRAAHGPRAYHQHSPQTATFEQALPPTVPQAIDVDDRQIESLDQVEGVLAKGDRPPGEFHALSPLTCQCLASRASTHGNTLAAERRALTATASPHGLSDDERLKLRVLRASELEARNSSASIALQAYYHLAEAEANRLIVARSLKEIDDAIAGVARMRQHGLQIPFDDSELDRQRLEILDKQIALASQIDQLNAELVQLMGLSTDDPHPRIWPTTDWTVIVAPIDLDAAVNEGLALRPEMGLLNTLRRALRSDTVDVTRGVLGGASGLLGTQTKFTGLLSLLGVREFIGKRRANRLELPERRRQLDSYSRQRRNEIRSEIQQAALEVEARLRQAAVAKAEVDSWHRRLDALAQKTRIDEASFIDVTRARLERLQAESNEIAQIAAWRIAGVKLREAQGRLVAECGAADCTVPSTAVEQHPGALELPAESLPPVAPSVERSAPAEQPTTTAPMPGQVVAGAVPLEYISAPSGSHLGGDRQRAADQIADAAAAPVLPTSRRQATSESLNPPPLPKADCPAIALPDVAAEAESFDAPEVDPEA